MRVIDKDFFLLFYLHVKNVQREFLGKLVNDLPKWG
jgi:hypothetical protein